MAVELKLVKAEEEGKVKLILEKSGKEITPVEGLKEGITIEKDTLARIQKLVELGQRYEEVAISFKSEFQDL